MVLPTGATCFSEAMRMGSELYHHLKALIKKKYGLDATAVGDEGGFAPNFQNNGEALELLVEAIKKSGYEGKIQIGETSYKTVVKSNWTKMYVYKEWTLLPASSSRTVNMIWTSRTLRQRRVIGLILISFLKCTKV